MDLDQLARQPASNSKPLGDLSFLVNDGVAQMAINLLPFFQHLVITCGDRGVVVASRIYGKDIEKSAWTNERSNPRGRYIVAKGNHGNELVVMKHFPALNVNPDEIVSDTGAGDSFTGSLCAGIIRDPDAFLDPERMETLIRQAQEAAVLSMHSVRAVSPSLGRNYPL